jgi:hypothetical protein
MRPSKNSIETAVIALAWLALACSAPMWRAAPSSAQESITASGEVVDLACYLPKGSKGARHRACAKLCAKKGMPLGLLTDDGELFLLIEDHDDPDPYEDVKKLAGERAEVTGRKFTRDGMASIQVIETRGL